MLVTFKMSHKQFNPDIYTHHGISPDTGICYYSNTDNHIHI
jgi:hypothetical protein